MVINYLHNIRNLNLISFLFKYKPIRMNQIYRILIFTITFQMMATSNMKFNHRFNRINSSDFINALMDFCCHFFSVFLFSFVSIGTHLFNLTISIFYFQSITSLLFTSKVNYIISHFSNLSILSFTYEVNSPQ